MTLVAAPTMSAAEEADLELERWGTRFVRSGTEGAYREWHFQQSLPLARTGLHFSLTTWVLTTAIVAATRPTGAAPWLAACALQVLLHLVGEVLLRRRPSRTLLEAMAMVGCIGAGILNVGLTAIHFGALELSAGVATLASVFALVILPLRPASGAVVAAATLILQLTLFATAFSRGELRGDRFILAIFTVATAFFILVGAAVVIDAKTRRSFRQERIIDAQRITIAYQRARSEALLKQELSHQVAERSRELGAVLARSDVTLGVRRLSPGERFDARYRIVSALGAGGMAVVYEVDRLTDGATLALKAVVGEVSGASAARFAREAEIGARVHHPNLVSIVDVGVSAGVPFLVMELARGGSLESQRARFGDVPWALPILRQIAEGLAALHDAGVVHRDLKPANVLLTTSEGGAPTLAKISDFGISRFGAFDYDAVAIDPNAATVDPSSPRPSALTGTGIVMGTPLYMAPEAARGGREVDAPADVFALGIIAYEMLTGRAPFSVPAVMLAMAEQPVPAAAPIDDARVPAALRSLVLESLAGAPAQRPRVRKLIAGMA